MADGVAKSLVPTLLRSLTKDAAWSEGDDAAERWHTLMSRTVPKGIRYARALQRILGYEPTLYTVVEYKDVALFLDDEFATVVRSPLDAADWRGLAAANRLVACALGHDLDRVPTRDEIQQNIQTSKAAKKAADTSSVSQACKGAYSELAEHLHDAAACEAVRERAAATDDRELTAAWAEMLQSRPGFVDECTRRAAPPAAAWTAVPQAARLPLVGALSTAAAPAWSQIDQLNSYAKISSNIPTGVMSRIETMASKLASDLHSGSVTMDTLNLQNIGEQVLSNCDAAELSKMSENIGDLLPVLTQMGAAMPGGLAGMPGMPGIPGFPPANIS